MKPFDAKLGDHRVIPSSRPIVLRGLIGAVALVLASALSGCLGTPPSDIPGLCPPDAGPEQIWCHGGDKGEPDTGGGDTQRDAGFSDDTGSDDDIAPPETDRPDVDESGTNNTSSCSQDLCGDQCVDLTSSSEHCGQCGQSCEAPRSCQSGECVCPNGSEYCDGECIDVSSDGEHCGSCWDACLSGYICVDGDCHADEKIARMEVAINEARSTETDCNSEGVYPAAGPVQGHPLLHEAAQVHADDMAENDFFSHTGSDDSSFSQRIAATGYPGSARAENIAAGGSEPEAIVQRWLDSDGHCRNLMNSSVNEFGLGFSLGGQWGSFWVLKLGQR